VLGLALPSSAAEQKRDAEEREVLTETPVM
jgi:hypothetical protein